jgi:Asp-tRNA(Asn)/Glu-tRNA(Gln) amidotransferase C subunit
LSGLLCDLRLLVHHSLSILLGHFDVSRRRYTRSAHAAALTNAWRADEVKDSYPRDVMFANAPGVINENLIKLPRVLPQEEA